MNWLMRLRGWWRCLWGFCPLCNSDAPALYDCPICMYYHGPYPPSRQTKEQWRLRFVVFMHNLENWGR